MSIFLVIRTLDVNYAAVSANTVQAGFDGGALAPVPATSTAGTFEVQLPAAVSRISIRVVRAGFFNVDQNLVLNSGPTPTLSFDGVQAINVRNLDSHTRGSDFNVEVFVVLGQLRDASAQVTSIATSSSISLALNTQDVPVLSTPILNPAGTGFGRIRFSNAPVSPTGTLFFVERTTVPSLIAIYRPNSFATHPTANPQTHPLDYHLFFHPFIPSSFSRTYPFQADYVDLISRYMLAPLIIGGQMDPFSGKQMVHQHEATGQKAIFIFPIGSPVQQMGTLNTQTNTLRLLQEAGYWIQRMDGVPFPLQPVGKAAMSCFSAGVRFLASVLMGARNATFFDQTLKEVYLFDAVFAANIRRGMTPEQVRAARAVARAETAAFNRALLVWWRRGQDLRSFRVYTQSDSYRADLIGAVIGGTNTTGPANARESDAPRSTILFAPAETFWRSIDPAMDSGFVHQLIPAFFMEHAIGLNAF